MVDIALEFCQFVGGVYLSASIDGLYDGEGGIVGAVEFAYGIGLAGIGCQGRTDGSYLGGYGAVALHHLVEGVESHHVGSYGRVVVGTCFAYGEVGGINGECRVL